MTPDMWAIDTPGSPPAALVRVAFSVFSSVLR